MTRVTRVPAARICLRCGEPITDGYLHFPNTPGDACTVARSVAPPAPIDAPLDPPLDAVSTRAAQDARINWEYER